jgi:hypothetical protein
MTLVMLLCGCIIVILFMPYIDFKLHFSQEAELACYFLHAGFFFSLLSDPEDGSNMFLRNVG